MPIFLFRRQQRVTALLLAVVGFNTTYIHSFSFSPNPWIQQSSVTIRLGKDPRRRQQQYRCISQSSRLGRFTRSIGRDGAFTVKIDDDDDDVDSECGTIRIRDWLPGEGKKILDFLELVEEQDQAPNIPFMSFNPEGPLDVDCGSESLLRDSYNPIDGGCFIIAEDTNPSSLVPDIIGTAGLIVGTLTTQQRQRQESPEKMEKKITAAIRRCACVCSMNKTNEDSHHHILFFRLIHELEGRTKDAGATDIIALAYIMVPPSTIPNDGSSDDLFRVCKLTPDLLEQLGYRPVSQQLPGVAAIQYTKSLETKKENDDRDLTTPTDIETTSTSTTPFTTNDSDTNKNSDIGVAIVFFIGLFMILLVGSYSITSLIGFDTGTVLSSTWSTIFNTNNNNNNVNDQIINRGLGKPLSTKDLKQLIEDEKLQRTSLDDTADTGSGRAGGPIRREWDDLSNEEKREEMALMQIINGKDIRIK